MAITKGTWVATSGNLTTGFTLVIPAAVVANDIVVIGITNRDATANPTCVDNEGAGSWSRITTVNANTNGSISIWWKKASANTNGKTVTVGGCTGSASGALGYYRGAASLSSSPFGTPVGEGNASGNELQAGITTTRDGSMVIHLVGCTSNDTLAPGNRTATSPTTITEDAEGVSGGGSDCSLSFASDLKASAGATGDISWSQTDGTGASLAIELFAALSSLTADAGSYAIAGTAATLKYNRRVISDSGSYSITGTDANLKKTYPLTAESGTFTITGTAATLLEHRKLIADAGSYTISGTAAVLKDNRKVIADAGSYVITGTDAQLTYNQSSGYTLEVDSGEFTITGTSAALKYGRKVVADSGTFALTGTDASLEYSRRMTASSGSYAITGTDASLQHGEPQQFELTAGAGAFDIAGTAAALLYNRSVVADAGEYALTGTPATLYEFTPPPRRRKHDQTFASRIVRSGGGFARWRRVR